MTHSLSASGSIHIHPMAEDVYLDVSIASETAPKYIGSFSAKGFIDLIHHPGIPEACIFECAAFVVPSGGVTPEDLASGAYSHCPLAPATGNKKHLGLNLKKFQVAKQGGCISPSFVDTGAIEIGITIVFRDEPARNIPITATFTPASGGDPFQFTNISDNEGHCKFTVPPGTVRGSVTMPDGPRQLIYTAIERTIVVDPVKQPLSVRQVITIIVDSTINVVPDPHRNASRPIVVAGDVSGSMYSENRMDNLRATLKNLYQQAVETNTRIGLITWNHSATMCAPERPSLPDRSIPQKGLSADDEAMGLSRGRQPGQHEVDLSFVVPGCGTRGVYLTGEDAAAVDQWIASRCWALRFPTQSK